MPQDWERRYPHHAVLQAARALLDAHSEQLAAQADPDTVGATAGAEDAGLPAGSGAEAAAALAGWRAELETLEGPSLLARLVQVSQRWERLEYILSGQLQGRFSGLRGVLTMSDAAFEAACPGWQREHQQQKQHQRKQVAQQRKQEARQRKQEVRVHAAACQRALGWHAWCLFACRPAHRTLLRPAGCRRLPSRALSSAPQLLGRPCHSCHHSQPLPPSRRMHALPTAAAAALLLALWCRRCRRSGMPSPGWAPRSCPPRPWRICLAGD